MNKPELRLVEAETIQVDPVYRVPEWMHKEGELHALTRRIRRRRRWQQLYVAAALAIVVAAFVWGCYAWLQLFGAVG